MRIVIAIGIAYTATVGGLILLTARQPLGGLDPDALRSWSYGLMGLQAMNLLVFGGLRVSAAIRHDLTSRMIESHRLMPFSGVQAVLGYIAGAVAPALGVTGCTLLLALICGSAAGRDPLEIIVQHGALLSAAVLIWSVASVGSQVMRFAMGLLLFVGFIALQSPVYQVCPAILLVLTPFYALTFSAARGAAPSGQLAIGTALAVVSQLAFSALFIFAAARRYARPGEPTFGAWLGGVFLFLWVLATGLGILLVEVLVWFARPMGFGGGTRAPMVVGGLLSSMLISVAMLEDAGSLAAEGARRRDPARMRRAAGVVIVAILLIWALGVVAELLPEAPPYALAFTVVVVVSFVLTLVSAGYLLRLWRITLRGMILLALGLATWVAPLLAEAALAAVRGTDRSFRFTWLGASSPIGALSLAWSDASVPLATDQALVAGIMLQVLLAGTAVATAVVFTRRWRRQMAEGPRPTLASQTPA
jgi:hypothetical protein